MNLLARIAATAVAAGVAVWLIPGINLTAETVPEKVATLIVVAVLLGVVSAVVRPIVTFFTGCLVWLTLGLFLLVINAMMLMLTSWLADQFGVPFHVEGFVPAFFGALIISVVGSFVHSLVDDE